jgi:ribosomal protein L11 methyltransferase
VVANIIDGVLIRLQEDLRRALAPHGHLILTGILEERDASFRERFSFAGFDLIERAQNGEWVGYLLRARC